MSSRSLASDPARLAFVTFASTLAIQIAHETEHVLQMLQKYAWHWRLYPGLLGRWFDFEWIHMLYNGALWIALVAIYIMYRKNPRMWRPSPAGRSVLRFLVYFQGYHWIEHTTRIGQYYLLNRVTPRGLLGYVFPVLEFHFVLGMIVSVAMITAFVLFRPWPALQRVPRQVPAH